MKADLFDLESLSRIPLFAAGEWRELGAVAAEIATLPPRDVVCLVAPEPLDASRAAALFRILHGRERSFVVRLSLDAVASRALVEDAARAGCIAIEVQREQGLVSGLATGLASASGDCESTVAALRRARAVGIVTLLDLPLGFRDDDEGVFERAVRLCRRAMVSIPIVRQADPASSVEGLEDAGEGATAPRMDSESLDNGLRWARRKLTRHRAIWRRALWPGGTRALALRAGYRQRQAIRNAPEASYTPTMSLLRALNRTAKVRARHLLATSAAASERLTDAPRRAWLRTKAASDVRLRSLVIQVEGALDLRGARRLVKRVQEALRAGYERITIDVSCIDAVSIDVVTRFVQENRSRLLQATGRVRIEHLREKLAILRSQIGDHEGLRLLESAVAA